MQNLVELPDMISFPVPPEMQNLPPLDMKDYPPPPAMKTFVEMTARFVAEHGSEKEKSIINAKLHDESLNFNFLKSSEDPLHGYYKQKLAVYLSQKQEVDKEEDAFFTLIQKKQKKKEEDVGANHQEKKVVVLEPLTEYYRAANLDDDDGKIYLPDLLEVRLPKGMKRKEFETMKLTAHLAAWYGNRFWLPLRKRAAGFEFTNQDNRYFPRFFRFVLEYSIVFAPPKDLEEKMSKSDAYAAAVQDGFFLLLQMTPLQEFRWREGGVRSLVNWHASLEKDFANMEHDDDEPEPKTKTHTFDEPATLVPKDQFDLAQHPGSAPNKVSVSNAFDITLQSLSQNVATLKEKIAAAIQIPPHRRLKLTGKAGVLETTTCHLHITMWKQETTLLCPCVRAREIGLGLNANIDLFIGEPTKLGNSVVTRQIILWIISFLLQRC